MLERDIQNRILFELSNAGCTVWRQNTGLAWVGDALPLSDGTVLIKNPRRLHVGLCKGSSDIIGLTPDGRFLAVEVKTKTGKPTAEQLNFINTVIKQGGIAGVCRSIDEAINLIAK